MARHDSETFASLVELLTVRASQQPDAPAFTFLTDGEKEGASFNYRELDRRARAIAAELQRLGLREERALLLFGAGLDFVAAFFGCLYAKVVAVPTYPPGTNRPQHRLRAIVADSLPRVALTTSDILAKAKEIVHLVPELEGVTWVAVDEIAGDLADAWQDPGAELSTLAFLQYTSGSTASPKGVMVSHGNLLDNERMIRSGFEQSESSVVVGWLPLFHDMGLIGNVLQPLYVGGRCVLMSPLSFLQRPERWLQAISRYRGTTSGGPNFSYDLCVRRVSEEVRAGLDLSSWTVAYNGAEPVRADTLKRFARVFAPSGFRPEAFYPCYGLAEATLFVSGGKRGSGARVQGFAAASLEQGLAVPNPDRNVTRPLVGCGHAWLDGRVRIVDPASGEPLADGRVGEVWFSGPSVAQGYWNRPEETERTFGARLEAGGPAFLRTGDLGFLQGEELFVTGRLKDLIIIRGRNHYPQDIELTAERSHPALRAGCGAAFSVDVDGDERLIVAFELERRQEDAVEEAAEAVRRAVAEEHAVEVHEVVLLRAGTVPKTSSGKIQRQACRAGYLKGDLPLVGRSRVEKTAEPETAEAIVTMAREDLLRLSPEERRKALLPQVGLHVARALRRGSLRIEADRPLTALGLDSLSAVELKHEVETDLGVALGLPFLLEGATLEQIAARLADELAAGETSTRAPLLCSEEGETEFPLSYGQRGLWFLSRLMPDSAVHHITSAARTTDALDAGALRRAFETLIARHPALRTTFGEQRGEPVQRIHDDADGFFRQEDAAGWSDERIRERLVEEARRPFDLETGPLLRVTVLSRLSPDTREHVLLIVVHHIIADFWSLAVLMEELGALYCQETGGAPAGLDPLPVRYGDFAVWQERELTEQEGGRLWSYWRDRLAGAPALLEIPADRARPAVQSHEAGSVTAWMGPEVAAGLREMARQQRSTPYMVLLAAFQALLHRHTGQDDLVVGSPTAGRSWPELSRLFGYFVNPVVLRTDLGGEPSFHDLLARTRQTVLEAFEHQDFPFALLVERLQPVRNASRSPLVQAMFVLQKAHLAGQEELADFVLGNPGARVRLGDVSLEALRLDHPLTEFDLTLTLAQSERGLSASMEYSTDLFEPATVSRMLEHFGRLLAGAMESPDTPVADLPLLGDAERRQLLEWSGPAPDYPRGSTIHAQLDEQAALRPEAVALQHEGESLTYRELRARANRLAHHLRRIGVGTDSLVAVSSERSFDLVVGVLGILKAGGAYVPLDPNHPVERLTFFLEETRQGDRTPVVVAQSHVVDRLPLVDARLVVIDAPEILHGDDPGSPEEWAGPETLAYILYTSGSTGRPKGVAVPHRGVVRLAKETDCARFAADETFLLYAPLAFDASTLEMWPTLLNGGKVAIVPPGNPGLAELGAFIKDNGITTLWLTAALMQQMVDAEIGCFAGVRQLLSGGDVVPVPQVRRVLRETPGLTLVNGYGPTESTVFTTCFPMSRPEDVPDPVPVGRVIANTRVYILDAGLRPVPVGVPGEICIGGDGLARGYHRRPDLTAERFVPDPMSGLPGERLYRTGDRARFLPGGLLDFQGRFDDQVKVRGFRVEPAEIAASLLKHPEIREAAVLARGSSDAKRLVAYVVPIPGASPTSGDLRAWLRERLPESMVPSAVVFLDAMPLNANGKVDRKALPEPEIGAAEGSRPPSGPVEELLAGLWAEVLGAARVGADDNFFELGGHSLLATRLISRIRESFGVDLPLRRLFEAPTVAGLAQEIEAARSETLPAPPLQRRVPTGDAPASFAQERLWFLDQLEPGNPAYNMPAAVRLLGRLDGAALAAAFAAIADRHEVLRTTFALVAGRPVQRVAPTATVAMPRVDLSALPETARREETGRLAAEEACRPFDLAAGPLMRMALVRLGAEEHMLLVNQHHIVSDGWSMGVLIRELGALYGAFREGRPSPLPELDVQYADYAVWQREWLQGEALETQLRYWRERLAGPPPRVELPGDRPRSSARAYRGAAFAWRLAASQVEALERLSRASGTTLFMTLLAGFQALLARHTGEGDVTVGSPIANRNRVETEPLIGFFVNTLALRSDLRDDPAFSVLLGRVREATLGAYAHQDIPFERLVEAVAPDRSLGATPLFQTMFTLQASPFGALELPGLTLEPRALHPGTTKFDLTVSLSPGPDGITGYVEYDRDVFDETTVVRVLDRFERLLTGVVERPDAVISELPLLGDAERQQLLDWSGPAPDYPRDSTIHALFDEQAALRPEAVALECAGESLTYRELRARTNRLAHHLRAMGVGADSLVALATERSFDLAVAVLGILKAGGAYVPLDPSHPVERLALFVEETRQGDQPPLVVTQSHLVDRLPADARLVLLDDPAILHGDPSAPEDLAGPDNLAYIVYTSGSTGRPKGVAVPHRAVVRLVKETNFADLGEDEVFLQFAPLAFDASTLEVWGSLLNGGRLVIAPAGSPSLAELGAVIHGSGVTTLWLTAALMQQMVDAEIGSLVGVRQLVAGGDVLPVPQVLRVLRELPGTKVINGYGPTENTTFTCCHPMSQPEDVGHTVPIGRPIANTRIHILDANLHPVPAGVWGELFVGGDGLARGYHRRPDLTAERFIPDPVSGREGERLYRTGDRVRFLAGGVVEFQGRFDDQVKIRGFRVEPGEIAAALLKHPRIREAAVLARGTGDARRLVAYVVSGAPLESGEIRSWLRERLPEAMVPSAVVFLDAMPLNANGKVDRKALPDPEVTAGEGTRPPSGPVEERLAGLWAEVLGAQQVGADDNFFELGGHSLMATRLVSRIRESFGVDLPLRRLFEAPTVAGLAREIEAVRSEALAAPPLRRRAGTGDAPASFSQERLWFLDQLQPDSPAYNLPVAVRLLGRLDEAALEAGFTEIVRRHEALRTTFVPADAGPVQRIFEPAPVSLPRVDLSALPESLRAAETEHLAGDEARRPFDLAAGPLLRTILLRLGAEEHSLLLNLHHVVSDGWSMGVLIRELGTLYADFHGGRPSSLPELPVQYADFAEWQRGWLQGEALEGQIRYWRERLAGPPARVELPADRPRPANRLYRGAILPWQLSAEALAGLERLAQASGATLFMTLLAGFQALLARCTGEGDITVGSPIAGRNRVEVEPLIGFFVNTLALRTNLGDNPEIPGLLARVKAATLGAYSHQDIPFERLVEAVAPERSLGDTPLFQVMFGLHNAPLGALELPGLVLEPRALDPGTTKFDLTVNLSQEAEGLAGTVEYDRDLFDQATVTGLLERFERLLTGMVERPGVRVSELPLMDKAERLQLREWNRTETDYPRDACIHELFIQVAARRPDAVAVELGERQMTYRELDERSNQLARLLLRQGVGPEVRVGLCIERTPEMLVAMIGILKSGGAYVPLDPAHPAERLAFMLADTGAPVLVGSERLLDSLPQTGAFRLRLDADSELVDRESSRPVTVPVTPENVSQVMYTSGSTGRSKGVLVLHRGVVRLVRNTNHFDFGEDDTILQFSAVGFDTSFFEIWGALLNGGRLALGPARASLEELGDAVARHGVNKMFLTTALFHQMVELRPEALKPVEALIAGGEAMAANIARRMLEVLPGVRLLNGYGPTESTTFATWHAVDSLADVRDPMPIGRPLSNSTAWVLDRWLQPVPEGVPGELCLGGDGNARGYLNRPELTADRWIPHPLSEVPGERLYRTGDLVRMLPGEILEYLGRIDNQIKLRGFRIEPGEIEAVLRRHPAVREAVVLVREQAGDRRLVAWVERLPGQPEPTAAELADQVRAGLPEPMVPSAFVVLDQLPLTPNGKVDRKALPDPGLAPVAGSRPPSGPVEELLASLWAGILGVREVGAEDNFFQLGGHSLLATRVVSRVRESFGVDLPLRRLFETPTVAGLAREIEALRAQGGEAVRPLRRRAERNEAPASFAQERLWFLDQLQPGNPAYNMPVAVRLLGQLDEAALESAFAEIVRRHDALRTTFAGGEGGPVQRIGSEIPAMLRHDLSSLEEAERLISQEIRRPFDLAAGPLMRTTLIRLGAEEHVLVINQHHIVSDGWSLGVLIRELGTLYSAFRQGLPSPLSELAVQYADVAEWQREWLRGEALETQLGYWRERLAGPIPELELPTAAARPELPVRRGALVSSLLPSALADRLRETGRRQGATLFMTLLAAFETVLYRYTGQPDLVVGTPIAGRRRREVEDLIGFFLNTLALRTDLSGDPTFAELLGRVRETTLGAYAHQDIPFEKLVTELQPERSLARTPFFQVMFNLVDFQELDPASLRMDGLRLELLPSADTGTAKFDLTVYARPRADGVALDWVYDRDLLEEGQVEALAGHFRTLLEAAVTEPDTRLSALPLVPLVPAGWQAPPPSDRRSRLAEIEWTPFLREQIEQPIHARFEEQARRNPDRLAVRTAAHTWTYRELDARAEAVAEAILTRRGAAQERVALLFAHDAPMVAGMLGALKAGRCYVPLDPTYPPDRLAYILEDSGSEVVITAGSLHSMAERLAGADRILDLDELALASQKTARPVVDPRSPAYMLYTSGSTGLPKGVVQSHRNVLHHMRSYTNALRLRPEDRLSLFSSYSFDASVMDIYGALLNGAALLPKDIKTDGLDGLGAWVEAEGITVYHSTPTVYRYFVDTLRDEALEALRLIVLGGEEVQKHDVDRYRERFPRHTVFVNGMGPTESTLALQYFLDHDTDLRRHAVPVGWPVEDTEVLLLNAAGEQAAVYGSGEIAIRSAHVALGYWNRPELTEAAFRPDPAGGERRVYRTGDLGRRLPDGSLEFVGRKDRQVKIRGFRVELGEIEARLVELPGVREAAVVLREDGLGERRLVAYVAAEDGADALRAGLGASLPSYMVPAVFVFLDALPLTPTGKIDRLSLPDPDWQSSGGDDVEIPRTATEEILASLWAEVLGRESVGVHADFFDLGGHSLLATRLVSRVRAALGVDLPLRSFFDNPTVAGLASQVEVARREKTVAHQPLERRPSDLREVPLSFAQQRLWFLQRLEPGSAAYHIAGGVRLSGPLDLDALARSLDGIVRRHEVLRSTFAAGPDGPVQIVNPGTELPLPVFDVAHLAELEREEACRRQALEWSRLPFDLERGPVARAGLVRTAPEEHLLVLSFHHVVADGWSLGVLVKELGALYEAHAEGRPAPLPELPVQYGDFALWQRGPAGEPALAADLEYWKERLRSRPEALALPTDRPRPAVRSSRGARHSTTVPAALAADLRRLGRAEGATLFMTLLAAFKTLLHRLSGQDDILVGTPVANRHRVEIEGLIGCFVNTVVLRTGVAPADTLRGLLAQVRQGTLAAYDHEELPFERLVEELHPERNLGQTPLFQVLFVLQNAPMPPLRLRGLTLSPVALETGASKFDLALAMEEATDGGLLATFEYGADLFDAATVARWAGHFRLLLEAAARPDERIADLALLDAPAFHQIVHEWNPAPHAHGEDICLHILFEAQVEATPAATALVCEGVSLTYLELNSRANQAAHHLMRLGVGPETLVGVCMERSVEMVVALLAILKAGGAYVPLDPSYPADRLAYMLADSRVPVLLTQEHLAAGLPPHEARVVVLGATLDEVHPDDSLDPAGGAHPDSPAYAIYTSGSTGRPKGAVNTHRAICNRLLWMQEAYGLDGTDRVLQKTPFSFDVSVWEFFWPLITGAGLVMARPGGHQDPAYLVRTVIDERITTMHFVPSMLQVFLEAEGVEGCAGLRRVICSGEALGFDLQERFFSRLAHLGSGGLHNLYGPTEAAVDVTYWACERSGARRIVPIGRPIANIQILIVDREMRPVPVGVAGELLIGGVGLARGYLHRPELTAERFVPHPLSEEPGARVYRTGDLARHLPGGEIEYLGRIDHQVKLRGFRIELGEIEAVLAEHPAVLQAAVLVRQDQPGDQRLVGYFVPEAGEAPASADLRAFLRQRLPEHMVPGVFVTLDAFPLSPSGKLERRALPAPATDRREVESRYEAPRNETEEAVAAIWREVLGLERVGVLDNFFELGGHSLLATRVLSRVRARFGYEPELRTMYEEPTVERMARAVAEASAEEARRPARPKLQAVRRGGRSADALLAGLGRPDGNES